MSAESLYTALRAQLGQTQGLGRELVCLDCIDSTNSYLKRAAEDGAEEGLVVVAEEQTNGRGRRGRSFTSLRGKGVFLSLLMRPAGIPPERLACLTALTAVAVCRGIETVCPAAMGIKWTNDLILHGKKLGGILVEMTTDRRTGQVQALIAGIGLNVSQQGTDFSPEVAELATSLRQELGTAVSRPALIAAIVREMESVYRHLLQDDTEAEWLEYRRRCVTLGKEVCVQDAPPRLVFAEDVDRTFGLVVREADGSSSVIRFGEVSVRGLGGYV